METAPFEQQNHTPITTPEITRGSNEGIIPGYLREQIAKRRAIVATRMAARALNNEALLQSETIFPSVYDLREMPETD